MNLGSIARRTGLLVAVVLLVASSSALASGSPNHVRVVYPTGTFPDDHLNVQAAFDRGGTVLLKATNVGGTPRSFNFGERDDFTATVGSVVVETPVTVLGETRHGARTTIEGGVPPIIGRTAGRLRISGIHFDRPLGNAVIILEAASVEFTDNRISRVVPLEFGIPGTEITGTEGRGIKFLGLESHMLTTTARVSDNIFEGLDAEFSDAILFEFVDGDVDIRGNHIDIARANGIWINRSGASFHIDGNVIRPGAGVVDSQSGNGILITGDRHGSYRVIRNRIVCENPLADGVFVFAPTTLGPVNDLLIVQNDISMEATFFEGIGLQGAVSRAFVAQNRITGNGFAALSIYPWRAEDIAHDNVFIGNSTSGYESSTADVWLDTNTLRTVVVGHGGTAVDLGVDNRIIGLTRIEP